MARAAARKYVALEKSPKKPTQTAGLGRTCTYLLLVSRKKKASDKEWSARRLLRRSRASKASFRSGAVAERTVQYCTVFTRASLWVSWTV